MQNLIGSDFFFENFLKNFLENIYECGINLFFFKKKFFCRFISVGFPAPWSRGFASFGSLPRLELPPLAELSCGSPQLHSGSANVKFFKTYNNGRD